MKHGAKRRFRLSSAQWTAIIAFVLSFLAFGAVFLLPPLLSRWERPKPMEALGEEGKQRTLLLFIHDEGELTGAVALCSDTGRMQIRATGYPACTEVVYKTALRQLSECYAAEGSATAGFLSAVTGERYDAVISFSVESLGAFVARLGNGISYTLPERVGALPEGEQTLSALQIADVLSFADWEEGAVGQAAVHAGIVAAVCNRYLTPRCDITQAFNTLTSLCDERLTVAQFLVIKPELEQLAQTNQGAICVYAVPDGRMTGIGEARRFVLTE